MPVDFNRNRSNPLEQLFQLSQLQRQREQDIADQERQALGLALRLGEAGGDPSTVQGLNPTMVPILKQLSQARQQQAQQRAYEGATDPSVINALVPNIAGTVSPSGGLAPANPAEAERALSLLEQDFIHRGGNPADVGLVRERALLGARSSERSDADIVAKERFRTAQQMAAQSHSAGLTAAENRRQESFQVTEAQRREKVQADRDAAQAAAADRADFATSASTILASDPSQQESLYNQAFAKWGLDANQVMTHVEMGKKAAIAKQLGTTAVYPDEDPRLASMALNGKAYPDPLLGDLVVGSPTGQSAAGAAVRKGLYETLYGLDAATELFAKSGEAMFGVKNLQELISKTGGEASPYFAAWDNYRGNALSLISLARSGKVLNEREIKLYESLFAQPAQIRFTPDGKLDSAVAVRLGTLKNIIETEHLGRVPPGKEQAARQRMREVGKQFRADADAYLSTLPFDAVRSQSVPGVGTSYLDSIRQGD